MTMTGQQQATITETHPERLVQDSMFPQGDTPLQQAVQAIKNLLFPVHEELITQLRQPTPLKVRKTFTVPAGGVLGGGVSSPDLSQIIYTAPESAEAWLNRITLTSPQHGPGNPLTSGAQTTSTVNPGNPAAGNNFNYTGLTVPGTIQMIQYTLTTSATVANRTAGVTINGVTYSAGVAQTASLIETYSFYPGAGFTTVLPGTNGQLFVPIPSGLIVPAGGTIASNVINIQAGDQISNITIVYNSTPSSGGAQLALIGSTFGEVILTSPDPPATNVVPSQYTEGRVSAPHLDRGESISISGNGLTANDVYIVDLQLVLVTGVSDYTPRKMAPGDLTKITNSSTF